MLGSRRYGGWRVLGVLALAVALTVGTVPLGVQASHEDGGGAEVDYDQAKGIFGDGDIPSDIDEWALDNGASVAINEPDLELVTFDLNSDTNGTEFLEKLRDRPNVTWANYDAKLRTQFTPNDPAWPEQYGPRVIDAPKAWDEQQGEDHVKLDILDTGTESTHPDLDDNCGGDCGSDSHGHGTHVAGIAAAEINNEGHIAGMAQVDLESTDVVGPEGKVLSSELAVAILQETYDGSDVISMSLGGDCDMEGVRICPELQAAINISWDNDVVLVAGSGNAGNEDEVSEPASMDNVVAVGSVGQDKERSSWSNGGHTLDVVAPGEKILSTVPAVSELCGEELDMMCKVSGTSMATPHVSGLAALVRSECATLSNAQVVDVLTGNVEDLGESGRDDLHGHGLVDSDDAVLDARDRC